ncbi:MAG: hypothetical protein PSV35_04255, partial [bacterium]|nr:hypothetical protein [bacterium]
MKIKLGLIILLNILFLYTPLRSANAPIQRIDIMNTLWNLAAITQTAVAISVSNGQDIPCFTTTLDFQRSITIWAGIGQACVAPIT